MERLGFALSGHQEKQENEPNNSELIKEVNFIEAELNKLSKYIG